MQENDILFVQEVAKRSWHKHTKASSPMTSRMFFTGCL